MPIEANLTAQRQLIEALRDPTRFPHPVGTLRLIETHISFILLSGSFAYKIKKAVNLGFVDYTALAQRHFFCTEELRLNRRLAPQLYLEVVAITGTPAAPQWGGDGTPIEWAVKMVEFDQRCLLAPQLAAGKLRAKHVAALATKLAAFHEAAPRAEAAAAYGTPATILAAVEANFAHFPPAATNAESLAALHAWSRAEYRRQRKTFAQRKAAGFVRECHGDLHLGNILLSGGEPLAFDGIEFNPGLRWIDVISDLAFLVMDLAVHGRADHAWLLLNGWLEETGDHAGLALLTFYQAYRAMVRAKVAHLRASCAGIPALEREAALASAATYLAYARTLTAPQARALLITHGLSGTGKTTLARTIAAALPAVCLRSDVERKRLHGLAALAPSGSAGGAGLYAESATVATYERLAELARLVLRAGHPVIVDAACLKRWQRQLFQDLARQIGVPFLIIDCQGPESVLRQRIRARARQKRDASEATLAVLAQQRQDQDPLSPAERALSLTVDTTRHAIDPGLSEIRRRLAARESDAPTTPPG